MGSESAKSSKSAAEKKSTKSEERGRRAPDVAVRKNASPRPLLGLQRVLGNRGTSALLAPPPNGRPLPHGARELFDDDTLDVVDRIRIYTGEQAAQFADSVDAEAFAFGYDIVFAAEAFSSTTIAGRKLLAHEVAHVLQQVTDGLPPATHAQAEADADAFADDLLAGRRARVQLSTPVRPAHQPAVPSKSAKAVRVPERGKFYVYRQSDGSFVYVYNMDDVRMWPDELQKTFANYLIDAFPGATAEMAAEFLRRHTGTTIEHAGDLPADRKVELYLATAEFHAWVTKRMHQDHPELQPRPIPTGTRSLPKDQPPPTSSGSGEDIEEVTVRGTKPPRAGKKAEKLPESGERSNDPTQQKSTTPDAGGSIYGEPKGKPDGRIVYEPLGEMRITPKLGVYVAHSRVKPRVHFEGGNEWRYALNIFPNHASFDWTVYKGAEKIDTNLVSTGRIEYEVDFEGPGTYTIVVDVSSSEFIDDKHLTLTSPPLKVVDEKDLQQAIFESKLIGAERDKPFERDAFGQLKVKAGWVPLSIQSEIDGLNTEIAMVAQLNKDHKLSDADAQNYTTFFKEQLAGLKTIQQHVGQQPYVISGTFLNREDSTSFPLRMFMNQTGRGETDEKHAYVDVELYDSTLSPGEPRRSKGHGESSTTATDDPAAYAKAELDAVSDAMGELRHYNEYPDGTMHIGVQLLDGNKDVREWEIDTHTRRKTARKILTGVAAVGGVALLIASPFTGGASASIGVLLLEGVVAGATIDLVVDSINERLKTNTFHFDARFVMDMTALVTTIVGVGGTISGITAASRTARNGMLVFNLGAGATNFAMMTLETQKAIDDENRQFKIEIAQVTDNATKADMEEKHRARLASIMGSAAVSGGIMIAATGIAATSAFETEPPPGLPPGQRPPPENPISAKQVDPASSAPPPRLQPTTEVQNPPAKLPPTGENVAPNTPSTNAPPPPTPPPSGPTAADETITLYHGTRQQGYEGVSKGIDVAHSPGGHQDFGPGWYASSDPAVAEQASGMRPEPGGTGMRYVMRVDIPKSIAGKIVDVQPGGANRAAYEAWLKEPPSFVKAGFPTQPGFRTNEEYLSGLGVEHRGDAFEEFLKANNLSDADTILGEIGTPTTSGAAALPNRVSTQVVIRSQKVADEINAIMRGPAPPITPTRPPTTPPPTTPPPTTPPPTTTSGGPPSEPSFTATGPMVRVPVNLEATPTGVQATPANVLEIGAGPKPTDLGLPPDPSLVNVTATDLNPTRANVTRLDANQPIPPEMRGKFDTVIINNPREYTPDIARIGEALKPGGRIIFQGRYKGNPDFRPIVEGAKKDIIPLGYKYVGDEPATRIERFPDPKTAGTQSPGIMGSGFGRTSGGAFHKPVNTRVIVEKITFPALPKGQTTETLGAQIGGRVVQDVQAAKGTGGPSWANRVLDKVKELGLSPSDSAGTIEAATRAAGYDHGLRATLPDGTIVVTSARVGPNNFIVGIRPDGKIVRGMGTIEVGGNVPGMVRVSDVKWDQ